ncbi:hypothetical protein BGW41_006262 [Actinomortierella wolfii]|nr:hypothetical protein BGW41_006262 [Actinomortierella wolfii]
MTPEEISTASPMTESIPAQCAEKKASTLDQEVRNLNGVPNSKTDVVSMKLAELTELEFMATERFWLHHATDFDYVRLGASHKSFTWTMTGVVASEDAESGEGAEVD